MNEAAGKKKLSWSRHARACVCAWLSVGGGGTEYGGAQVAAMNEPQCVRAPGPKAYRTVVKMVSAAAAHLLFALISGEFCLFCFFCC